MMYKRLLLFSLLVVTVLCFSVSVNGQITTKIKKQTSDSIKSLSPKDYKDLKKLTTDYLEAFARNDQKRLANLVSSSTETIGERNDAWQQLFFTHSYVNLKFSIDKILINEVKKIPVNGKKNIYFDYGGGVNVYVTVMLSLQSDSVTKTSSPKILALNRIINCKKLASYYRFGDRPITQKYDYNLHHSTKRKTQEDERKVWLIVDDIPDQNSFADLLLSLKNSEEQRSLLFLETANTLFSITYALIDRAVSFFEADDFDKGLFVLQTTQTVREEEKKKNETREQKEKQRRLEQLKESLDNRLNKQPVTVIVSNDGKQVVDLIASISNEDELALLQAIPIEEQTIDDKNMINYLKYRIANELGHIAYNYNELGNVKAALDYYQQSAAQYESLSNEIMMASVFENIGNIYEKQNDTAQALNYLIKSYEYGDRGLALRDRLLAGGKEHDSVIGYSYKEDAKGRRRPVNLEGDFNFSIKTNFYSRLNLAQTLHHIGEIYQQQKDFQQATQFYKNSADQYKILDREADVAEELLKTGKIYEDQKDFEKAWSNYEKTIQQLSDPKDKKILLAFYLVLFSSFSEQTDYKQEAVPKLAQTLKRLKTEEKIDKEYFHIFQFFYVMVLLQIDDTTNVAELLEEISKGLEILDNESVSKEYLPSVYYLRGMILLSQSENAEAVKCFQKPLHYKFKETNEEDTYKLLSQVMIGAIYSIQGSEKVGLNIMSQRLTLRNSLASYKSLSEALNSVGDYYRSHNNILLAIKTFQRAISLAKQPDDNDAISLAHTRLADIYTEQKDYKQAEQIFLKNLSLTKDFTDKNAYAFTLSDLGDFYYEQGFYGKALENYELSLQALRSISKESQPNLLCDISKTYLRLGNKEKALSNAEEARKFARKALNRDSLWQACNIVGEINLALNRYDEAFQAFDESIKAIELMRLNVIGGEQDRQVFLEDKTAPFRLMIELLVKQNRVDEALKYAERSKARVLLDVMQFGKLNLDANLSKTEQTRNTQLLDNMTKTNFELRQEEQRKTQDEKEIKRLRYQQQKARLEYETFQAELYALHPELQKPPAATQQITADEAISLLPDAQTAILEFVVTDKQTYLFVLAHSDEKASSKPAWRVYPINISAAELKARVSEFHSLIAEPDQNHRSFDYKIPGKSLYNLLLVPAAEQLKNKKSLIIVPDGELWNLPFQVLQTNANVFLLEESSISYIPSLAAFRELRKQKETRHGNQINDESAKSKKPLSDFLAFGNPSFNATVSTLRPSALRERLSPIPEAETEVKESARKYQDGKFLIRSDATEERFKQLASNFRILHFATHGFAFDESPMYSNIALASGNNKDDGFLEAREIMGLKLNADLAILSACKTAQGRVGNGEGMIGLTWAFSVAGVPTVVASQWAVNSASTSELMIEFHDKLKEDLSSKNQNIRTAGALRHAALSMLKKEEYKHPYYWGGFIVVGIDR